MAIIDNTTADELRAHLVRIRHLIEVQKSLRSTRPHDLGADADKIVARLRAMGEDEAPGGG